MQTPAVTKSVFIAEDSIPVRARLVEMLSGITGVSVVGEAETPAEAVTGIIQTLPDYVVLDLQLKGGTGTQVLRAVRSHLPRTVFIVLTNHAQLQFRQACTEAGADAFFDKSTETGKVKELIATAAPVRRKQLRQ